MINLVDDPNEPDILVEVRRRWNDDATAKYALDSIFGWHWNFVGARMADHEFNDEIPF